MKKIIYICTLLLIVLLTSCKYYDDLPQTDYPEETEDLERYILAELGEYIKFAAPFYNDYFDGIELDVTYIYPYLDDEELITEVPPEYIMERTRELYNSYISDNEVEMLTGQRVVISFSIPGKPKGADHPYTEIGYVDNYDHISKECTALMTNVSLMENYDWSFFYGKEDILSVSVFDSTEEEIVEILENIPNVNSVYLSENQKQFENNLSQKYDGISFLYSEGF